MADEKRVVTNVAEVSEASEQDEAVDEQSTGEQNKVVCRALFLSAQESQKGKLGITIMLYDGMNEKGQVRVSLEQKSVKGQNVTISPVISTWFDPKKTDEDIFEKMKAYLDKGGLSDVYAIVSGSGEFRKIHNFLTTEEYNMYLKLIG